MDLSWVQIWLKNALTKWKQEFFRNKVKFQFTKLERQIFGAGGSRAWSKIETKAAAAHGQMHLEDSVLLSTSYLMDYVVPSLIAWYPIVYEDL